MIHRQSRRIRGSHDLRWYVLLIGVILFSVVMTLLISSCIKPTGYHHVAHNYNIKVINNNSSSSNIIIMEQRDWIETSNSLLQGAEGDDEGTGIVAVVMPSPPSVSGPSTRIDRLVTIRDTWGSVLVQMGADAATSATSNSIVFVLDENDPAAAEALSLWGSLNSTTPGEKDIRRRGDDEGWNGRNTRVLVVPGDVSNGGSDGDARLRHVLELVSAVYSPRFLFYCNEHTFVIAENLQCFVQGLDPAMPAYLGNRFRKENNQGEALLNSGAAGFILSRGSLDLLAEAWNKTSSSAKHFEGQEEAVKRGEGEKTKRGRSTVPGEVAPECVATSIFERNNPGITLARCLKYLGVEAEDTTDAQGGQRFNAYGPVRLAEGKIDQWYKDVHASNPGMWQAGPGCCSSDTISFHYVGPAEVRAMHEILHHREKYLNDGYDEAFRIWPSSGKDLGAYAPAPQKGGLTFNLLLQKIALCPA